MNLHLNEHSHTPIWEQIVQQVKEMVLKGILQVDDKLLSVRELSAVLLINPNTVSKAYQELERQGVIGTKRGKGTFVTAVVSSRINDEEIQAFQQKLKVLVIESSYLGITHKTLHQWVDQFTNELGGNKHVNGSESP